jgi:predicted membrane-bound dolichyl-phosphate-mannose-protein mannosyltransferase
MAEYIRNIATGLAVVVGFVVVMSSFISAIGFAVWLGMSALAGHWHATNNTPFLRFGGVCLAVWLCVAMHHLGRVTRNV